MPAVTEPTVPHYKPHNGAAERKKIIRIYLKWKLHLYARDNGKWEDNKLNVQEKLINSRANKLILIN